MKILGVFISILLFNGITEGQTLSLNIDSLSIISIDSNTLSSYNWMKCSTNSNDTVIVLSERNFICDKELNSKLNRIYLYVDDDLSIRLNVNNIYIDGKLMFPRKYAIYIMTCAEK